MTVRVRQAALVLAALALGACGGTSEAPSSGRKPDVLVLLIDTLRADRLGCYGYARPTSPNLDALAAEGAVFRRASAQAPWTIPSVSSILTGRYLTSHQERPAPDAATMAEVFRDAGYRTLGLCANFVIMPEVGFGRGFEEFVPRSFLNEHGRRQKRNPGDFATVLDWLEEPLARAVAPDEGGARPPLFLYVHPVDPHAPYERHPSFNKLLPEGQDPVIGPDGWMVDTLAAVGAPPPDEDPGWAKALREIRRQRTYYDREVRFADQVFRRLLMRLKELGVGEDLIVAVISDHGEELWEHLTPLPEEAQASVPPDVLFYQSHGYLMSENALRTPFLLSGPGVPKGRVVEEPVENVDLFPTLLELCGIQADVDLHGVSLVPLLNGEVDAGEWRDETYAYVQQGMTIRDEASGMKLVLPTTMGAARGLQPELYDLNADPLERTNLAHERVDEVQRLTKRMQAYLERFPSTEQTVTGEEAEDLLELLNEFGYGGDMIRAGAEDQE